MAIYHLTVKPISRGTGRSAVACASYRSGERLVDERTGMVHDYSNRRGIDAWVEVPSGAPAWARDREKLWNQVEAREQRKDARLAREVELALPKELSREEQRGLVADYVRESFVSRGMVADVAIHRGDPNNPHAHVMLTTRRVDPEGFGKKQREWDRRERISEWREAWAERANRELERSGSPERIDHRSYAARGLEKEPTLHEGPSVREMEERGIRTERADRNREVHSRNAERARHAHQDREAPPGRDRPPRQGSREGLETVQRPVQLPRDGHDRDGREW